MTKITTFIVDDEEDAISSLQLLLQEYYSNEIEIIGTAYSIAEAVTQIDTLKPHLLFLDIELAEGNGFEVVQQVKERTFEVIFVTAYEQYALKAIRINTLAYLLKPLEIKEFRKEVDRSLKRLVQPSYSDLNPLLTQYKDLMQKKIGLPVQHGVEYVSKEDILWVEAERSYSSIHLRNDKPILVSRNLKYFEKQLEYDGFLRIHHSIIVNVKEISRYDRLQGGKIFLTNGKALAVSRKYHQIVQQVLQS